MSTLRVANINNASAPSGGISIDTSGTVTGALPYPNRNLLYNGAMQVAQRGTNVTGISGLNFYTADRWAFGGGSMGVWTYSMENDGPIGSGFTKSSKVTCTTADSSPAGGDFLFFIQRLEGQDLQRIAKGTASAQQLTLSFWVKSNVTGTYIAELVDSDNNRSISLSYTVNQSATWERKIITFPADTTGIFDNDNASSLQVTYWLGSSSTFNSGTLQTTWATATSANRAVGQTNLAAAINNYWQITGVQLETGPVATPFEFKSYGQELIECQRYFQRITSSTAFYTGLTGWGNGTTSAFFPMLHSPMRIAPIPTITGTASLFPGGSTSTTFTNSGQTTMSSLITATLTVVDGKMYALYLSANGALDLLAEL